MDLIYFVLQSTQAFSIMEEYPRPGAPAVNRARQSNFSSRELVGI
jgi:hypothetical protein